MIYLHGALLVVLLSDCIKTSSYVTTVPDIVNIRLLVIWKN